MQRHLASLSLIATLLAAPVTAQIMAGNISLTVDPGRAEIDAFAVAIDTDRDSRISRAEMEIAGRAVFASMDVDGDTMVTRPEMLEWEHGMSHLADFRGRRPAYDAAMGSVFDMFDRDGSGTIDAAEHADGVLAGWALADLDGDGTMSLGEYRDGYVVTAALRGGLS